MVGTQYDLCVFYFLCLCIIMCYNYEELRPV